MFIRQINRHCLILLLLCLFAICLAGCASRVQNVLNTPGVQLVAGQDVAFRMPSWSNSGAQLVFVNLGGMHAKPLYSNIYTVTVTTGAINKITNDNAGLEASGPTWSYDDREIAYAEGGVYMIKLGTDEPRLVANWANDGALSPVSDLLALWGPTSRSIKDRGWKLVILDLDNMDEQTLFTVEADYIDLEGLAWTRDGQRIALSMPTLDTLSAQVPRHWYNIYTLNIDGKNLKQITDFTSADARSPTWSADGRYIAYIQGTEIREGVLMIMNADGSCPVQLLDRAGVETPSWSPNGNQLAFEYRGGIYILDLTEKEVAKRLEGLNCKTQ